MKAAAKAWAAGLTAPLAIVIMYFLSQLEAVAAMPEDVRAALAAVVLTVLGGLVGAVVYFVPNTPKEA